MRQRQQAMDSGGWLTDGQPWVPSTPLLQLVLCLQRAAASTASF